MKLKEKYLKAKYEDKIIFKRSSDSVSTPEVHDTWMNSQGIWKKHPVFGDKTTKEVIEWLRGDDML